MAGLLLGVLNPKSLLGILRESESHKKTTNNNKKTNKNFPLLYEWLVQASFLDGLLLYMRLAGLKLAEILLLCFPSAGVGYHAQM